MGSLIDLTGMRFGRWVAIERDPIVHAAGAYWICKCDCGTIRSVNTQALRKGKSTSCGCYHAELTSVINRTHGKSKTRLHNIWSSIRERCNCKTSTAYKYYGGKGIKLCKEWEDYEVFEKWALSNGYDANAKSHACTIDRIDNSKGYSPDNCRWVDSTVQANNQTRNVNVTFNGKTKTIAEWGKTKGWNYRIIYDRIQKYGWSVERALTEEPRDWGGGHCRSTG
jgi:hypothetical protein